VDFFLFPRVKSELAGLTLFQENYRNSWEGVVRIITNEEFAAAFRQQRERYEKCVRASSNYAKR
jgi:hypothetical protein